MRFRVFGFRVSGIGFRVPMSYVHIFLGFPVRSQISGFGLGVRVYGFFDPGYLGFVTNFLVFSRKIRLPYFLRKKQKEKRGGACGGLAPRKEKLALSRRIIRGDSVGRGVRGGSAPPFRITCPEGGFGGAQPPHQDPKEGVG